MGDTGASPGEDPFVVEVSNDAGASWSLLEQVGAGTPLAWVDTEIALNGILAPTGQMQFRFTAADLGVSPATVDRYTLHLRPNKALSEVSYSLYRVGDDGQETEVDRRPLGPKRAALPFPIQLDATSLDEGPLRLVIDAEVR